MVIGIPREVLSDERRVSLVPERVAYLVGKGQEVLVETGAGGKSSFDDEAYTQAGAGLAPDARALYARADLVLKVRAPGPDASGADELGGLRGGCRVGGP